MPLNENPRQSTVVVTVYETLPDVLARLRSHSNSQVVLEIPQGSPLFLTGTEFRSLREVALQRRIDLSIATGDPLRAQLAGVFNLPLVGGDDAPPPRRPSLTPGYRSGNPAPVPNRIRDEIAPRERDRDDAWPAAGSGPDRRASDRDRATWPRGRGSSMPGPVPNRTLPPEERRATDGAARGRDDGARDVRWPDFEQPGDRSGRRASPRPDPQPSRSRAGAQRDKPDGDGPVGTDDRPVLASRSPQAPRQPMSGRMLIGLIAGGLVALLVLTLVLGIFVLSSARVVVALDAPRVSGTVDCEIVEPGTQGSATVVVEGQTVDIDVTTTASVPTSGTRPEPDAPATGRVVFSNPTSEPVTISAGTELQGLGGRAYTVTSDVTVAAGNAALGEYGSGEAVVEATEGGTAGNLAAGEVSGVTESGVYYSNRNEPMTGGTDREVPVVAPADIEALHAAATEQLRQQVANNQNLGLGSGVSVVPATAVIGDASFEDDLQAGDEGGQISTTATATASVLTYVDGDLRSAATAALTQVMEAQLQPGQTLSASTIQLTQTTVTGQTETGATIDIAAVANTAIELTEADLAALSDELAGQSPSDVNTILSEDGRIASFDVEYSPGWIPDRMPSSPDRITIEVRR